jgi:hypothetical protein
MRLMIHLEATFSVTNEAISELLRFSETTVRGSGTDMWKAPGLQTEVKQAIA